MQPYHINNPLPQQTPLLQLKVMYHIPLYSSKRKESCQQYGMMMMSAGLERKQDGMGDNDWHVRLMARGLHSMISRSHQCCYC